MQYNIIKKKALVLEEVAILVFSEIHLKKINYLQVKIIMIIKEILMLYQNINSQIN